MSNKVKVLVALAVLLMIPGLVFGASSVSSASSSAGRSSSSSSSGSSVPRAATFPSGSLCYVPTAPSKLTQVLDTTYGNNYLMHYACFKGASGGDGWGIVFSSDVTAHGRTEDRNTMTYRVYKILNNVVTDLGQYTCGLTDRQPSIVTETDPRTGQKLRHVEGPYMAEVDAIRYAPSLCSPCNTFVEHSKDSRHCPGPA